MKLSTTQKAVKNAFRYVIAVPYYSMPHLLYNKNLLAFNFGKYGWNCDVYDMGNGIAITTGYRPFGNVKPARGVCNTYDDLAAAICYSDTLTGEEKHVKIEKVRQDFLKEVLKRE